MKINKTLALLITLSILLVGCSVQQTQSDTTSIEETSSMESSTTEPIEEISSEDTSSAQTEEKDDRFTSVTYTETLIKYPEYPEGSIPRDYDYKVRVIQGNKSIELPVYNPVYASDYFNREVYNFDQHRRYAEFAFTGDPVTVEITVYENFSSYTIMPSSKAISSKINGNVITYTLTEPCTTVLKLGNDKDTHLTIFAEAPETERPKTEGEKVTIYESGYHELEGGVANYHSNEVLYFKSGYHEIEGGVLDIGKNAVIYLEPGALVKARVNAVGDNIKIYGRGAFIESSPSRNPMGGTSYMCMLNNSMNVTIQDVRFLDAHTFNLVITSGMMIKCTGVKFLCNQISTDGVSVWDGGVYGFEMDNCYFNISDNVFVISGGIMNFKVTNTIIMTDYAVFFPQGKVTGDPLVFENIDILRFGNFMKHEYPEKPTNKEVNLIVKNCCAIDNDRSGGFLKITDTKDAEKTYLLKNISLPSNMAMRLINSDSGSTNATLTFDNVWIGNTLLTQQTLAGRSSLNSRKNEIIFTDTNDQSAVCTTRNTVNLTKAVTVQKLYVGERPLSPKYRPYKEGNTTYVSAYEILEVLGFENIKVSGGKLTFTYKEQSYETDVEDERAMVSTTVLSNLINTSIAVNDDRIQVKNIQRRDNLLENPDFEDGLSMPWTTRNFTKLYESNDAYSGEISVRMDNYRSADGGIYQDIADILRQYGRGTYEFTAWVKKASDSCNSTYIRMGVVSDWNYVSSSRVNLTDKWTQITYTYTYTGDSITGMYIWIGNADGSIRDILVDNVSMIKL